MSDVSDVGNTNSSGIWKRQGFCHIVQVGAKLLALLMKIAPYSDRRFILSSSSWTSFNAIEIQDPHKSAIFNDPPIVLLYNLKARQG